MKLKSILKAYSKYLLLLALVLSSIAISIRGSNGEVNLILADYPLVIFVLVVTSSILVAIYFRYSRKHLSNIKGQIKEQAKFDRETLETLLAGLTERQRQVYFLVIEGKTNKEIMETLFIEQSTLKTHINHIYRKLNIKSRSELKSKLKPR